MEAFTPEQVARHAEMLANRVKKRQAHFARRYAREGLEAYRLYDWDIPEIRAVVDWYAGRVVVAEYERLQHGPDYLPAMARAVGEALGLAPENVFQRRRHTAVDGGPRYRELAREGGRFPVRERELLFLVNLTDRLDTGLFSDHRDTRRLVQQLASGADFLNLYAYTGAFTCAAAAGGALTTVTVDRSATYLDWTRSNLDLNGLGGTRNLMVQADSMKYLEGAAEAGSRFTLAFVDPPSFSGTTEAGTTFEILRDHPELLRRVLAVMAPGGTVFFSANHQRFEPALDSLVAAKIEEITNATLPEDYRNSRGRLAHRCWRITAV